MNALPTQPNIHDIKGTQYTTDDIIAAIGPLLTDRRRTQIAEVISRRTYTIVPVLEGIYDYGNANAVMRSAEALGYQYLHYIDLCDTYKKANRVSQGADKWLDIVQWENTRDCMAQLKREGYRILATSFEDALPIDRYAFDQKTAIVFGNEQHGVSDACLDHADGRVRVPMDGFTKSFNISVAAALSFYHIRRDRMDRLGAHGDLSEEEQRDLVARYYIKQRRDAPAILRRWRESNA